MGHGVRLGLVGANSHGPYPAACRMVAEDGVQFPLHDNERPEIGIQDGSDALWDWLSAHVAAEIGAHNLLKIWG